LNFRDPARAFPDIFLEGSPKEASGSAEKAPGAPQTWRPNAIFSIKNQFRILKSNL
jgi:hypothetical protein